MGGYMLERVMKAAEENNAEKLVTIYDKKLASLYTKYWQE